MILEVSDLGAFSDFRLSEQKLVSSLQVSQSQQTPKSEKPLVPNISDKGPVLQGETEEVRQFNAQTGWYPREKAHRDQQILWSSAKGWFD